MRKYKMALVVMIVALCTLFGCGKTVEVNEQNEIVSADDIIIEDTSSELEENLPHIDEVAESTEKEIEEVPEKQEAEDTDEKKTSEAKSDKNTSTDKNTTADKNTATKPNNTATTNKAPQTKYPYYIKVNRQANCVTIYAKDENGAHTVPVKAMVCSVGKTAGSTPAGVFKISARYTWRALYGNQYGQYAVRFNGPILFHSVPYAKQSKDSLKTDYYNRLGAADSMGCVRLTCADAKWIYDNCTNGTVVEVYDSPNPGPLGKPSAPRINVNSPYKGWDPTDPDAKNPWRTQKPTLTGIKNITTDCGKTVDLLSGISAKDANGNAVGVTVSGNVDFNTPGTYNVTYTAKSVSGSSVSASAVVTVLEVKQETDVNQKPNETPEVQPEKPEVKPEETPEGNPEVTPEVQPETPDVKPEEPVSNTEEEQ